MPRFRRFSALYAPVLALTVASVDAAGDPVDFTRDIQPILAGRCYDCHGPEKAKGGLRLSAAKDALKGGDSGEPVIVAGQSAKSALIARVTSTDEDEVMPQKGDRLTPAQIALLKRWIDEGAVWPENTRHWAYVKPVRPPVPGNSNQSAVVSQQSPQSAPITGSPITDYSDHSGSLNPIDAFVRARLAKEGLTPAPELDKARWLRRVSLDLIGLPPTPAEIDDFLADASPQAHERVVDRLLASPHYGERWARPWLDLARYADSHGFQRDDLRDLWPYRDWVIRAMNADMPFDQFTIWQIAGDLVAEAANSKSQTPNYDALIATGFHRATPTNVEAGTDQEEGRVNQVFDRVNTTASVWLGSTLECAQCHNHKYDPFTQKDYYQLFAFFNNTPVETAFASPKAKATLKFTGPYLELPDPAHAAQREQLQQRLRELDTQITAAAERVRPHRAEWERATLAALASSGQEHPLEIAGFESRGGSKHRMLPDGSVLLVDRVPDRDTYVVTVHTQLTDITGFKLEALTDPSLPGQGPGRGNAKRPNFILNQFSVTAASPGAAPQPIKFARATASYSQPKFEVSLLLQSDNGNRAGWAIGQEFHRPHWAQLETEKPLGDAAGTTLTFTLVQNFGMGRTLGRVRLSALTGKLAAKQAPADIVAILRTAEENRTKAQAKKVEEYFLGEDDTVRPLKLAQAKATAGLAAIKSPRTLVMRELPKARTAHVLKRGNFLDPGEEVVPGTPATLPPLRLDSRRPGDTPALPTRLDLARWLVDRENPLVARVTVNRWWAEFFGRGIVGTLEDFGVKGDPPTHPELLDWLAVEFMDHGWSMKHIHKLIALSATYRQSSRVTPELLARDDQNRLLARGPRFRLDAETIRDNALALAGLLSPKMGGPPVHPYQPPGLWDNKVGGDKVTYVVSQGEDAYRRGIYTVWKRSSPYPSFMNFDATARTACTIKRSRSNTPLQALTLLNDPVYVEAALHIARRVLTERANARTEERLAYAFKLCLARAPAREETDALKLLLEEETAVYAADPAAAKRLVGKLAIADTASPAELAAWHSVATTLLNLDEMITK